MESKEFSDLPRSLKAFCTSIVERLEAQTAETAQLSTDHFALKIEKINRTRSEEITLNFDDTVNDNLSLVFFLSETDDSVSNPEAIIEELSKLGELIGFPSDLLVNDVDGYARVGKIEQSFESTQYSIFIVLKKIASVHDKLLHTAPKGLREEAGNLQGRSKWFGNRHKKDSE